MQLDYLLQEIYNLKSQKEILDNQISTLKEQGESIAAAIDEKEVELLSKLDEQGLTELEADDLVCFKCSKKNVGYTDESQVINLLKNDYNGLFVKTKVSESIDKNALKKELKVNTTLQELLVPYINSSSTEYVVVTTKENKERMLEHINDGKK